MHSHRDLNSLSLSTESTYLLVPMSWICFRAAPRVHRPPHVTTSTCTGITSLRCVTRSSWRSLPPEPVNHEPWMWVNFPRYSDELIMGQKNHSAFRNVEETSLSPSSTPQNHEGKKEKGSGKGNNVAYIFSQSTFSVSVPECFWHLRKILNIPKD